MMTIQCFKCNHYFIQVFSYPGLKAKRKVKVDRTGSTGSGLQTSSGEGKPPGVATSPSSPSNGLPWAGHHFLPTKNITKVAYSCFENKSGTRMNKLIKSGVRMSKLSLSRIFYLYSLVLLKWNLWKYHALLIQWTAKSGNSIT